MQLPHAFSQGLAQRQTLSQTTLKSLSVHPSNHPPGLDGICPVPGPMSPDDSYGRPMTIHPLNGRALASLSAAMAPTSPERDPPAAPETRRALDVEAEACIYKYLFIHSNHTPTIPLCLVCPKPNLSCGTCKDLQEVFGLKPQEALHLNSRSHVPSMSLSHHSVLQ